ncbi:hypothetical protein AAC387_Pa05g2973 [Persea americana]
MKRRKWEDMEPNCLANIFSRVGLDSLIFWVPLVCKSWHAASSNPLCWKVINLCFLSYHSSLPVRCSKSNWTRLLELAVDNSRGSALELVFPPSGERYWFNVPRVDLQHMIYYVSENLSRSGPDVSHFLSLHCLYIYHTNASNFSSFSELLSPSSRPSLFPSLYPRRGSKAFWCRSRAVNKMSPQSAFASCEEMRSTVSDWKDSVVCPKPRRPGLSGHGVNDPIRLRWHLSHQVMLCDSKAGTEVLDLILSKGGCGPDQVLSPVASSPPYFCGSPPSRAANPVVHDARFGMEKLYSVSPLPVQASLASSPSSAASPRKGCAQATFGLKPAAVRIEGFNCLDRDGQNRSIPAMA